MKRQAQDQRVASYLNTFPEMRQWVIHCMACGRYGAHPEVPFDSLKIGGQLFVGKTLAHIMPVNEAGLCEQCAEAVERSPGFQAQKPLG